MSFFVNLGLPHTGTESFAAASLMVGIPVLHVWAEGESNPAALADFLKGRMSLPLCSGGCAPQALTDTPFYVLRSAIAQTYPDSSFVCTSRSRQSWVESMVSHAVAGGAFLPRHYNVTAWDRWRNGSRDRSILAEIFETHAQRECLGVPMIDLEAPSAHKWRAFCAGVPIIYSEACRARSEWIEYPSAHSTDGDDRMPSRICTGPCGASAVDGSSPPPKSWTQILSLPSFKPTYNLISRHGCDQSDADMKQMLSPCPKVVHAGDRGGHSFLCPYGRQHWDGLGHVFVELWTKLRSEIRTQRARQHSHFFAESVTRGAIHLRPASALYAGARIYCHELQYAVLRNLSGEGLLHDHFVCHHIPELDEWFALRQHDAVPNCSAPFAGESDADADALMRSRYWELHSSLPEKSCSFPRGSLGVSVHLRLGDLVRPTLMASQLSMTAREMGRERLHFLERARVSAAGFRNALEVLANATAVRRALNISGTLKILVVSDSPFRQLAFTLESTKLLRLHRVRHYHDGTVPYTVARVDPLGLEIDLLHAHPLLSVHCLAVADILLLVQSDEHGDGLSSFGRMASLLSRGRTVVLPSSRTNASLFAEVSSLLAQGIPPFDQPVPAAGTEPLDLQQALAPRSAPVFFLVSHKSGHAFVSRLVEALGASFNVSNIGLALARAHQPNASIRSDWAYDARALSKSPILSEAMGGQLCALKLKSEHVGSPSSWHSQLCYAKTVHLVRSSADRLLSGTLYHMDNEGESRVYVDPCRCLDTSGSTKPRFMCGKSVVNLASNAAQLNITNASSLINDIYLQCRHHRDQAYALASSTSRGRVYGEALRQLMAVNPEGALLMEFARGREDNVAVALQTRALRSAGVCIRGLSLEMLASEFDALMCSLLTFVGLAPNPSQCNSERFRHLLTPPASHSTSAALPAQDRDALRSWLLSPASLLSPFLKAADDLLDFGGNYFLSPGISSHCSPSCT